jgi:hypothetical protein
MDIFTELPKLESERHAMHDIPVKLTPFAPTSPPKPVPQSKSGDKSARIGFGACATAYEAEGADGSLWAEVVFRAGLDAPTEMNWLWPGRIPRGQVTVIEGEPGVGKSFVALDLAARFSRGAAWPAPLHVVPPANSTGNRPGQKAAPASAAGDVLLVTLQDDCGTIDRRLHGLGADQGRVVRIGVVTIKKPREENVGKRLMDFPLDMVKLKYELEQYPSVGVVVIDPLTDFCERPAQMTRVLRDLNELAQERNVAIIVTLPANCRFDARGSLRVTSRYRTDAARCLWAVVADPDDPARKLFVARRTNSFVEPTGLAFRLHQGRVLWNAETPIDPADPLGLDSSIRECLSTVLSSGSRPATEVFRLGAQCGFTPRQLRATAKRMGIESRRTGGYGEEGGWEWVWPGAAERAEVPEEFGDLSREEGAGRGERSEGRGVEVGAVVEVASDVVGGDVVTENKEERRETGEVGGEQVEAVVEGAAVLPGEGVKNVESLGKQANNCNSANGRLPREKYARAQERKRREQQRRAAKLHNGRR